ncbi:hypothetical protein [Olleya marilimosa]|uniref:hypothetical protein n=1 Tax=Olleya marilimosa TaxID=272164 RepID=UPI00168D7940|nr:hypothetical protein [Olleya marilimosa]MBD3891730.1 hypothetical protein [Olleya marilimosa]
MKYKLIIFYIIIIGQTISAQNTIKDSTLTLYDNIEWLNNFESQILKSNKIELIKHKINADTLFTAKTANSRIQFKNKSNPILPKEKIECDCKIQFLINLNEPNYYLLDPIAYPKTTMVLKLINLYNIEDFYIIKQAEAAALFGEQAKCGVLILKTKNKQLIKKVKQIL